MDYTSILINLIIAIIVAVLTSNLSLRGFYRQEIWLRKETKYSQIIDSLNKTQRYYWHLIDEHSGCIENENDEENVERELREEEYILAKRELEMLSSSPVFMLNNEVIDILDELMKSSSTKSEDERNGDWVSYFDRPGYEAKEAKIKIAEIANKDLGIKVKRRKKKLS
ncbi:hypothetical protein [[Clostridium] fimetarium]|uniref:Uncharacterized protein n=1 Tax=[Clostridium] fimetarium TaxID=99656 RepID=A0A1I0M3S7_9FIRM|nr:hypothetical protein [[Clostridium] fimetarium]SEV83095.1 hypothetical protein SAMN05421659_101168 [[Clostridium] fimetarium]